MSQHFAIYDPGTGRILAVMELANEARAKEQGVYIECTAEVSDDTHFVNLATGRLSKKRAYSYKKVSIPMGIRLVGLPLKTEVSVEGASVHSDSAPTDIVLGKVGEYRISLSGHIDYVDQTLEVTISG